MGTTDVLNDAIREITQALRKADGRVAYVYVRPSQRNSEEQGQSVRLGSKADMANASGDVLYEPIPRRDPGSSRRP